MAYLHPDKIIKEGGLVINQKLTPDGYSKKPNKKMVPKGVTVHNTSEIATSSATNPAEQYARATYPNGNMGYVAVHYWVYKNVIWQQLRDDEQGWHAGGTMRKNKRGEYTSGNLSTISIECIGDDAESEATTQKLVAVLLKRHGLTPPLDVYSHNYWMHGVETILQGVRKNCPIYILPHWDAFLKGVSTLAVPVVTPAPAPVAPPEVKDLAGRVKVIYDGKDGLNARKAPVIADNVSHVVYAGSLFTVTGISTDGAFYRLKSGLYISTNEKYVSFVADPVFSPYLVRIAADVLNIRKGPGVDTLDVGDVFKGEVFTIVNEKEGWGLLKSGIGWISLKFTEKI